MDWQASTAEWKNSLVGQFLGAAPNFISLQRTIDKLWNQPLTGARAQIAPLWIHLYNIPLELYSREGLSYIASALGVPVTMDSITASKTRLEYAKVCIEIGAKEDIPETVEVILANGKTSVIFVEVPWGFNNPQKQKNVLNRANLFKVDVLCLLETRVKPENSAKIFNTTLGSWNVLTNYDSAINGDTDPKVQPPDPFTLRNLLQIHLPTEVITDLIKNVTIDEIKEALFNQGNDKAPGPDGFTPLFFKHSWSVIGDDFVDAVKYFFQESNIHPAFNSTIIALIPKIQNPSKVRDFRPISCCSVVYKTITKILVKRMNLMLPDLISLNQTAFVKGGSIIDNTLLAQELVKGYGYFKGQRGISQGDPLSPILFVIAMNILSKILNLAATRGNLESIVGVTSVLNHFYVLSGMNLNVNKTEFYAAGIPDRTLDSIKSVTSFKQGFLPIRYLGVPLVTQKLTEKDCLPLYDNIKHRLHHWSAAKGAMISWDRLCCPKSKGAILDRLPTRDRLIRMGIASESLCILCNEDHESRNHLFVDCIYATSLWNSIMNISSMRDTHRSWDSRLQWAAQTWKGKSLLSTVMRITWTAFIYFIWEERNRRIFNRGTRTTNQLLKAIKELVRIKINDKEDRGFNRGELTMFNRLLGKPKQEPNALTSLDKLHETLEMLEKKEKVLLKKAAAEVEKVKEFTKAKNKRAAIQCLKRKRLYEQQIEQLGNFELRIHDQMIMLEGAKATTETVDALRTGAAAMKAMQKATNIDDVDKTMDEINEQTENMKQIQEALSTPIGAAADFDEDELEAELEELEGAELEEQLLQPATTAPAATVQAPAGRQPARNVPQKRTSEEDELAALQSEMAL
ncbi:Vacuolar protein sorting-associated protein 32-like protein 1 [Hibiscus syriacus]|uniref:Vacuolar protein sorting-associated protein 32-like protein 1 n=3 Tax=Magnoliopsida TaxID=3398 RepID=A0A6A3CRG1_HIBSY|nr:Vacuolar protein sorting-associated protein 32-like protein 1 [Hibiscus syriacus]